MGSRYSGVWIKTGVKSTTDAEIYLGIKKLKDNGCLVDGSMGFLTFPPDADSPLLTPASAHASPFTRFWVDDDHLALLCDWGAKRTVQHVRIIKHPENLGGYTYYFRCKCGRRCSGLYLVNGCFQCRRCAGLNYSCQRSNIDRLITKIKKIHGKLGRPNVNVFSDLGPRPKRMWRKTYAKLKADAQLAEAQLAEAIIKRWPKIEA